MFCRVLTRIHSPIGILRTGQGRVLPDELAKRYEKEGLVRIQGPGVAHTAPAGQPEVQQTPRKATRKPARKRTKRAAKK